MEKQISLKNKVNALALAVLMVTGIFFSDAQQANAETLKLKSHNTSAGLRFRQIKNKSGVKTNNDLEYRAETGGAAHFFDETVRLEANARTGKSFVSSWPATGVGRSKGSFDFHVRHLFAGWKINSEFDATYGSLFVNGVQGNSLTTFDSDGYLMGGRLLYTGSNMKGSLTYGNITFTDLPSVFERFDGFESPRFISAELMVPVNSTFDTHYSMYSLREVKYGRLALVANVKTSLVDSVTIENARQFTEKSGNVFYVHAKHTAKEIMSGQDLVAKLYYGHQSDGFDLLIDDKVQKGHQARIDFNLPGVWKSDWSKMDWHFNYIKNLSYSKQYRVETGVTLSL